MKTTLEQLYSGEIFPQEQYRPILEEYIKKRKEQYNHYDDFIEKLESPLKEEFIRIMDEQMETIPYEFSEMFIDGFRLGARMLIEILDDKYQLDKQ